MSLKKIKDNYFENLKMSKYELFVKVIDYIGNFPNILDGFYINGSGQGYGDYDSVLINSGFNEIDEETSVYIGIFYGDYEERVYYTYEEMLHYFLTYYLENIHCYSNLISFIEQEFVNYTKFIDEAKNYKINLDIKNIFTRDNLRNFLLNYNFEENRYNLGTINFLKKEITYWDINIKKKFFSYLLGKKILKNFLSKRVFEFKEKRKDFFGESVAYDMEFEISKNKERIEIKYYNWDLMIALKNRAGISFLNGLLEKNINDFITKEETEILISKKYKNEREKENIEIISKKDFLKELEIIVNAYEDIYNDNEVQKMFENFKKNF